MSLSLSIVYGNTKWGQMAYLVNDEVGRSLQYGMIHEEDVIIGVLHNTVMRSKVILDIGAHAGSHCLLYAKLNPTVVIHAFEPQSQQCALLKHNIKTFNVNVTAHNIALGNKECDASMCGFIRDGPNAGESIVSNKQYNLGGRQIGLGGESVKIKKLDDIMDELKLDTVSYIKLDVEGFENLVLDGGYDTLKKHRPVVFFENNHKHIEDDMVEFYVEPRYKDVFATLISLEYSIINVGGGNYLAM